MIAFVKGIVEEVCSDSIIIEKDGLGIQVYTTTAVIEKLQIKGSEVKLYTHFHVKEDAMQLFGFLEKEDLKLFKLLITVNGIGPKAALSILSSMSTDTLVFAILSEDIKTISTAQGVGKKIAQKIVVEIKDKVGLLQEENALFGRGDLGTEEEGVISINRAEAVEVLVALGYSKTEALKAVNGIEIEETMLSEEIVKLALKTLI